MDSIHSFPILVLSITYLDVPEIVTKRFQLALNFTSFSKFKIHSNNYSVPSTFATTSKMNDYRNYGFINLSNLNPCTLIIYEIYLDPHMSKNGNLLSDYGLATFGSRF